jgi:septum formation protein
VAVVLASASPARCRLLRELVAVFEVVRPDVDESEAAQDEPRTATVRLAEAKARRVAAMRPGALVIAADTMVVCGGRVIGKPSDRRDAIRILEVLTSSPHRVVTGLFVLAPDGRERSSCVETGLRMRRMSRQEIERYVDGPGALERAGVYALQEDDPNVKELKGSPSAVMGLPLEELSRILREFYPPADAADRRKGAVRRGYGC